MIRHPSSHRASKEPTNPDPGHPKRRALSGERHLQTTGSIYNTQLLSSQDSFNLSSFLGCKAKKMGLSQVVKLQVATTIGA